MCICVYVYTCASVYVYVCVYVCTCVRVYVCTCVRVYVCTCVRVCGIIFLSIVSHLVFLIDLACICFTCMCGGDFFFRYM